MLAVLWLATCLGMYAAWRVTSAAPGPPSGRLTVAHASTARRTLLTALQAARARVAALGPAAWHQAALDLMRLEAEAGNYAEAHRLADRVHGEPAGAAGGTDADGANAPDPLAGLVPVDAVRALVVAIGASRVVMVNEAHHVPQHRALTLDLLRALRSRGFTHFAAETLHESDALLDRRGYPTPQTGTYVDEPLYGDLVRVAIRLGYRLVPYEARYVGHAAGRELEQATNLAERVLRAEPGARLLVHAGYAHVSKAPTPAGARPMALRLRELTGIDPFTIDQTEMTEHSAPEYEHPLYRRVMDRGVLAGPTVFAAADGAPWSRDRAAYDATVFHPRTRYVHGRPTWLLADGARAPYPLPPGVCGRAERCLVEARAAREGDDAVPVDRVEVTAGSAPPALALPPGDYRLRVLAPGAAPSELRASVPAAGRADG
jgi:hypothetical protein